MIIMTRKEFIGKMKKSSGMVMNLFVIAVMMNFACVIGNGNEYVCNPFSGWRVIMLLSLLSIFIIIYFLFRGVFLLEKEEAAMEKEWEKLISWRASHKEASEKGFEKFLEDIVSGIDEDKNRKINKHFNGFILLCIQNEGDARRIRSGILHLEKKLFEREDKHHEAFVRFYKKRYRFLIF